ncbi:MAG: dihydrolipoamide acetyltransferase family protein, partial [Gemmataceae bacterium]
LEGDKAAQEIESLDAGLLCIPDDAPRPGDTVQVGQVIGFLLAEGESPPASVGKRPAQTAPAKPAPEITTTSRPAGPAARRLAHQLGIDLDTIPSPDPTGRILVEDVQRTAATSRTDRIATSRPIATPRARRRASELGVDWTRLKGTGRDGRVRERDVLSRPVSSSASIPEPIPLTPGKHTPATKLRAIIAQRMQAGVTQAAPVTLTTKVDAAALVTFRQHLKQTTPEGPIPSYNDILVRLTAMTLRGLPQLNACWHREGIYTYDAIHVATAIDTESGLLAAVISDADQRSIFQIAERTRELIGLAREGRLGQKDLEGATFTVTNLGMFGIDGFTPILNLPQAGILGVGRIVEEPVVRGGQIVAGHTLTLSLTFDHRVVDGAPAARWLQSLCQRIRTLDPKILP